MQWLTGSPHTESGMQSTAVPRLKERIETTGSRYPTQLFCPSCAMPLTYRTTQADNAGRAARTDVHYYECALCGTFEQRRAALPPQAKR